MSVAQANEPPGQGPSASPMDGLGSNNEAKSSQES